MKKYLIVYFCILIAMQSILMLEIAKPFVILVSTFISSIAGSVTSVFDRNFIQDGLLLSYIDSSIAIRVDESCNALELMALLFSAILAFPATMKSKLVGLLGGLFAIQVLNVIRVVSLVYIIALFPAWFDWIHEYLWPFLMIVDGAVCFWIWISYDNYQGTKQIESA